MSERYEFEVYQDGLRVASAFAADREWAMNEAFKYASLYAEGGPVEVMERIGRKRVPLTFPSG